LTVFLLGWLHPRSDALEISEEQLISNAKSSQLWELCRMCAGTTDTTMIAIFNEDGSDKDNTALKLKKHLSVTVRANQLTN